MQAPSPSTFRPSATQYRGPFTITCTRVLFLSSLPSFPQAIVEDILLKSGLARPGTSTYGSTYMSVNGHKPVISAAVATAVEVYALDRLCNMLLTGERLESYLPSLLPSVAVPASGLVLPLPRFLFCCLSALGITWVGTVIESCIAEGTFRKQHKWSRANAGTQDLLMHGRSATRPCADVCPCPCVVLHRVVCRRCWAQAR